MDIDETRLYYDLSAGQTADDWYPNPILMPSIREFVSMLPEKARVLDLGCGPGYESMRLASAGAEVVGVDFSPQSIRIARERCPQCEFVEMDFRSLDNRLGLFDGVFACASLIHISPAEMPDVLTRVSSILKPDGLLLIMVRAGSGIRESWPVVQGQKLHRVVQLYSLPDLERLAAPFQYMAQGFLEQELKERGWRSYLFKVVR